MLEVSKLIDPLLLVEIYADAVMPEMIGAGVPGGVVSREIAEYSFAAVEFVLCPQSS